MKVIALICAAGIGKRMGTSVSKPFLCIAGKPILAETLLKFEDAESISDVYVIVSKREEKHCREDVLERYNLKKVTKIVLGGEERQDSVKNGLDAIEGECDIVMIHDGIRPFITPQLIDDSVSMTQECQATVVAVPVKETVKTISGDGHIIETLNRDKLWLVQTPQTFQYDVIKRAHKKAHEDNVICTDDSSLVERLGIKVKILKGYYENIKITTPEDLIIAEAFLQERKSCHSYKNY